MPMDSTQISMMTGAFNQQVMMGMQHSAMISQMYGGYAPNQMVHPVQSQGQQFAGLGMAAMGQMGMNALGSQRLNNFGGGVMQPVTQSGQWMMGQMQYGAQQQMMLDMNMQQSYRHLNEFGGRGFTGNQIRGVGQDLRQMSLERGPAGEQVTFEELGRLASNMGRMGMAEGVRSVKDFNEKFKTMLKTVKTIATELGTSLEEAQKVMASMKGSGVFQGQAGFASKIRAGALAGNLATEEMTGAMLIGSQISRSVGGLGRSGAGAGLEAITQIGAAQRAGVINEEDVYNATGLTGAEGRRAFMQQGLAREARFYKGQLGRRMLASIAGENGTIDEESLQELLAGGGGTGGTMQRASRNLGKIGRANFIRNEGRLRGAAMEELGIMGSAIQARDWLEGRGMDLNEMDDRSMLFFQRKFGVGRDEADSIIKMARGLDRAGIQRQRAQQQDAYQREVERTRRQQSPQELLKQLEQGRTGIQNQFRQAGADLYGDMGVALNEMLGAASGGYYDRSRMDLTGELDIAHRGGRAGREMLVREFGIGGMSNFRMSEGGRRRQRELFGEAGMSQAQFNRFIGGQAATIRGAGYELGDIKSEADYARMVQESSARARGFEAGGSAAVKDPLDKATQQAIRQELLTGGAKGKEKEFLDNLGKSLDRLSTEQGKNLAQEFRKATDEERARIAKDVLSAVGAEGLGAGKFGGAGQFASVPLAQQGFATREAEMRALGRGMTVGLDRTPFQSYAKQSDQFLEQAQYVLGGEETGAGQFMQGLRGQAGGVLGRVDAFRRNIRKNREQYAEEFGRAPRRLLQGGLREGGEALDWVTGGGTRGWAEGVFGKGGITGRGGMIDRAAEATGYERSIEGALSGWARKQLGGYGGAEEQAIGEYLSSKEGEAMLQGTFSSDEAVRRASIEQSEKRRMELSNKARNSAEDAEFRALQGIEAARVLQELGPNPTPEDLQKAAERIYGEGASVRTMVGSAETAEAKYKQLYDDRRRQFFKTTGRRALEEQERSARREADIKKLHEEGKIGGAAMGYMERMRAERAVRSTVTGTKGMEVVDEANVTAAQKISEVREQEWLKADTRTREEIAKGLSLAGEADTAARMRRELSLEKRLGRAGGGDRGAREIASALGATFKRGELGKGAGLDAQAISDQLGFDLVKGGKGAEIERELQAILSGKITEKKDGKDVERSLTGQERASRLASLQERPELMEAQRAKQDKEADRNSPLFRELQQTTQAVKDLKDQAILGELRSMNTNIQKLRSKEE